MSPSKASKLLPLLLLLASPAQSSTAPPPDWPYSFTEEQIKDLALTNCTFDPFSLEVAKRMRIRGFTACDVVQACKDAMTLDSPDPLIIEKVASLRYVGVPSGEFKQALVRNNTVTRYYNSRLGGKGLKIGGWILFGFGLATVATGSLYAGVMNAIEPCSGVFDNLRDREICNDTNEAITTTLFVIGGAMILSGLPMAVWGSIKTALWAPGDTLDRGSLRDMEPYRIEEPPRPKLPLTLSLAPYFNGQGGGMGLSLQF